MLAACAATPPAEGVEAAGRPGPEGEPAGEEPAGPRRVLRERALKLAREPEPEDSAPRLELVEFLLSGERYAIESSFIREVYPLKELTPLPCTPPFVLGIVNIRGKILSVLDLRSFFELNDQGLSDLNKVLVLHQGGMEFGLLADAIVGVRTLQAGELKPTLPTLTEIRGEYLKGVSKERLVVLDAGKLLGDRRLVVHDEA
jgi:purine-binding chemotaxis protein CheW